MFCIVQCVYNVPQVLCGSHDQCVTAHIHTQHTHLVTVVRCTSHWRVSLRTPSRKDISLSLKLLPSKWVHVSFVDAGISCNSAQCVHCRGMSWGLVSVRWGLPSGWAGPVEEALPTSLWSSSCTSCERLSGSLMQLPWLPCQHIWCRWTEVRRERILTLSVVLLACCSNKC